MCVCMYRSWKCRLFFAHTLIYGCVEHTFVDLNRQFKCKIYFTKYPLRVSVLYTILGENFIFLLKTVSCFTRLLHKMCYKVQNIPLYEVFPQGGV